DHHIPWLIGPRIDSVEPAGAQRGTIVTIHGGQFAAARGDNHVTIGGTAVPVVAASATELRGLATVDVDSGPVKVAVGAHTATAAQDFTVQGYPGDGDDGPPVFATGAGGGAAGDVNPIGVIRVLVVICQAKDKMSSNLANVRTGLNDRWTNVQT